MCRTADCSLSCRAVLICRSGKSGRAFAAISTCRGSVRCPHLTSDTIAVIAVITSAAVAPQIAVMAVASQQHTSAICACTTFCAAGVIVGGMTRVGAGGCGTTPAGGVPGSTGCGAAGCGAAGVGGDGGGGMGAGG